MKRFHHSRSPLGAAWLAAVTLLTGVESASAEDWVRLLRNNLRALGNTELYLRSNLALCCVAARK
jgi:hypothetical protein